jgi:hypothetical protein
MVQSNEGQLVVFPGTTLDMECIWMRKFGTPVWEWETNISKEVKYVRYTIKTELGF